MLVNDCIVYVLRQLTRTNQVGQHGAHVNDRVGCDHTSHPTMHEVERIKRDTQQLDQRIVPSCAQDQAWRIHDRQMARGVFELVHLLGVIANPPIDGHDNENYVQAEVDQ